MQFSYTAKTAVGELTSGILEGECLADVRLKLRQRNLFPVDVTAAIKRKAAGAKRTRRRRRASRRDILGITTQLAIMTRTGMDLAGALKSLARQCRNPRLQATLEEIHTDVTGGLSVSEALNKHAATFGDAYVASITAGEVSGRLPEVLQQLSGLLRSDIRNRNTLRSLLAYPVILTSASFMMITGLMCFVLPEFAKVFKDAEVPLPALTELLIGASSMIRSHFILLAMALVTFVSLAIVYFRSQSGRRQVHYWLLNLRVLRGVTRPLLIGRTFRLLGITIESGVPLLEGLQLTRRSVTNLLYQELFDNLESEILNGRTLGPSFAEAEFVPSTAAEMVITGETTGTLSTVTQLLGDHYEEEGQTKLKELATVLEPAIVIVMGVVVAVIVLSVMLPMFDMSTMTQGK